MLKKIVDLKVWFGMSGLPKDKVENVLTNNNQTNCLNSEQTSCLSQANPTDLKPTPSPPVTPSYFSKTERNQEEISVDNTTYNY
jgi:hypothetical protein